MTAFSAIQAKAADLYPSFPIDFEDGTTITLKSMMELDDVELKLFSESQKKLSELDESDDISSMREEFISILCGVSDNKTRLAEILKVQNLGVLTTLFKEYAGALKEGTKSEDPS